MTAILVATIAALSFMGEQAPGAVAPGLADLKATLTDTPDPVRAGEPLAWDVTVTNHGALTASDVAFTLRLGTATFSFVGVAPSDGGNCGINTLESGCSWAGPTAPGTSRTARISVIPRGVGVLTTTLIAFSATVDPVAGNNLAAATTTVIPSDMRAGGRCTILGDNGPNILTGTPGKDIICGLAGKDILIGLGNNDVLRGGPGNDTLTGNAGRDVLVGRSGRDRLNGGSGNDRLNGGSGNDRLDGGSGNDVILGGRGRDDVPRHSGNDVEIGTEIG